MDNIQKNIQKNLNMHTVMHRSRSKRLDFWYKCPLSSCQSSFERENLLNLHLRIHKNDFSQCYYCPFKYIFPNDYQKHLKKHFGIKDFECDQCAKTFNSMSQLNRHYEMHEGIEYTCLVCEGYQATNRETIRTHFREHHKDIVGNSVTLETMQQFIKIIK